MNERRVLGRPKSVLNVALWVVEAAGRLTTQSVPIKASFHDTESGHRVHAMMIRTFKPADAEALAALFHASVHEAGIRYYTPEQAAAWSPSKPDPASYLHQAEGRHFFVAEGEDGQLLGYGDLEADGHIDHLYCRPDLIGTGVGSAVYAAIEATAKTSGIAVLFVEASEAARRLFERKGFSIDARNDFAVNGVAIHNYRMSKAIA